MSDLELENEELRQRVNALESRLVAVRTPRTSSETAALDKLAARAESIAAKFGKDAPAPRRGESPYAYRIRVLQELQHYSPTFADFDLLAADDATLDVAEREIYAAAERAASGGTETTAPLVEVEEQDEAGRTVTKFYGDPLEWMRPFMAGGQIGRIMRPGFES